MRLWSLHPCLLDAKGLVAAWREGLLAMAVLKGKTAGYRNHPQLDRFKRYRDPAQVISLYLIEILEESECRGYRFDRSKIDPRLERIRGLIPVTDGQVAYEYGLLKSKLLSRDRLKYLEIAGLESVPLNGVFALIDGGIESWEKIKPELLA